MFNLRLTSVGAMVVSVALGSASAVLHSQATTKLEMRLAETEPGPGLTEMAVPGLELSIYLHREAIISNSDVAEAHVVPAHGGSGFDVALVLSGEGSRKMATATAGHLSRPLAILIDDQLVAAPKVDGRVSTAAVPDGFSFARAEVIALVLTAK